MPALFCQPYLQIRNSILAESHISCIVTDILHLWTTWWTTHFVLFWIIERSVGAAMIFRLSWFSVLGKKQRWAGVTELKSGVLSLRPHCDLTFLQVIVRAPGTLPPWKFPSHFKLQYESSGEVSCSWARHDFMGKGRCRGVCMCMCCQNCQYEPFAALLRVQS